MRFFILPALALAACDAPNVDCDTMAVASVTLTLSDGTAPVDDATVQYSVNGEAPMDCESFGAANEWTCGWEVAGELEITVDAAGFAPYTETVTVESDVCHVITQALDLTLDPA